MGGRYDVFDAGFASYSMPRAYFCRRAAYIAYAIFPVGLCIDGAPLLSHWLASSHASIAIFLYSIALKFLAYAIVFC